MTFQSTRPNTRSHHSTSPKRPADKGQVLVLFVLFLLVLLGISALAIDYANWLLIDRRLQNTADHVALAGASVFGERAPDEVFSCGSGKCDDAREQAWAAFSEELDLNLTGPQVACLAAINTPEAGWTSTDNADVSCTPKVDFGHTLWVSTPPPDNGSYVNLGGAHPRHYGIVFARIDEVTQTFLGGVFGLTPDDRIGWATAGAAPTAFALQIFCRDHIAPQSGVCANTQGLAIAGQGGIRLVRGDIGGNQGLTTTGSAGGVIVENGQVFLFDELPCGASTYRCGTYPASENGIADKDPTTDSAPNWAVGQNALHIPPQAVPHYPSPVDGADHTSTCVASGTTPCIPFRPSGSAEPGAWTCTAAAGTDPCGTWDNTANVCSPAVGDLDGKPAMIPPGYYNSIEVPADKCAIFDPTGENSGGLAPYQLPGIYQFDGDDSRGKKPRIKVNANAALIGDGVTLVFDEDWSPPTGQKGFVLSSTSTFLLNTYTINGSNPTCASTTETAGVDFGGDWWTTSNTLPGTGLPQSAVCAAWEVNPVTLGAVNAWSTCVDASSCAAYDRDSYAPQAGYRGITFYFTPDNDAWPPSNILGRYEMGGASGTEPGIGFRALLYAPYDDVKISGGNGFNTIGQVLAWTAKFNGGSAYIDLDYPYDYPPGDPFLLEPTIGQ